MDNKTMTIPYHLGIIADGNRRWARERNLPTFEGHKKGLEKILETIIWCKNKGVKVLSLFLFSTENWNRSKEEIDYLMKLFKKTLSKKNFQKFNKENIKVKVIGLKEKLPKEIQEKIKEIEKLTQNNQGMILNLAISYGGRAEIVSAVKNIIRKKIPAEKITEETISQNLWAPDLDLLIRTGKEQRISNFMLWQLAYSELYFLNKYWPDFTEEDLNQALQDFANRKRRFGQ